jgi:hypothetical protein
MVALEKSFSFVVAKPAIDESAYDRASEIIGETILVLLLHMDHMQDRGDSNFRSMAKVIEFRGSAPESGAISII